MEKTCPLSSIEWVDDIDHQLNDSQKNFLKEKWNSTLSYCKGNKVSYVYILHVCYGMCPCVVIRRYSLYES